MSIEKTFGMIKPEGIERSLIGDIERRICDAALLIEDKKQIIMNGQQFIALYGHIEKTVPQLYEPMKDYMTTNMVEVLKISGEDAVKRLLAVRGSSNPKYALPGTIRGDYANDQDYDVLYKQCKPALNVFHASGSEEEAQRALEAFFGR